MRTTMDLSYVDGKVREALMVAKGSRVMAQKLVITAALKDERLLQGLAAPFLKAIVGAAIERVMRRAGVAGTTAAGPTRPQATLSNEDLDAVLNQMGRSGAGSPADARSAPSMSQAARILGGGAAPAPAAGAKHETAMRTIAAAFARKKD